MILYRASCLLTGFQHFSSVILTQACYYPSPQCDIGRSKMSGTEEPESLAKGCANTTGPKHLETDGGKCA